MPATPAPATVDAMVGEQTAELQIADLDAGFRLKLGTVIASCLATSYTEFVRALDVAAVRALGIVTVVTSAEFTLPAGPLAVGSPLGARSRTTLCELSGREPGSAGARIGFECAFEFASPPGTGDPRRYRETVGGPEPAGSARIVMTMVRPHERP
ncbi:MAG: hypothetical protein ACJ786_40340, partial [Catenulispora sp.]